MTDEPRSPETPDPGIPQDPGIPGFDQISHEYAPPPDQKSEEAERRERIDDTDEEGHQSAGEIPPDASEDAQ